MKELQQTITASILEALSQGVGNWSKPWLPSLGCPINAASGKAYRGVNFLTLSCAKGVDYSQGFRWATYKQWQSLGAQVRKGSKGVPVVYWSTFTKSRDTDEGSVDVTIPFLRHSTAFHQSQVDGITYPAPSLSSGNERIEAADTFFSGLNSKVEVRPSNSAYYSPTTDTITMPLFDQFKDAPSFYSTLAHEHVHWSGAAHRLNRLTPAKFGSGEYAFEELVAEIGAAFLSAHLGIETRLREDHAPYIKSWLKVLANDHSAIFKAATLAQQAVDFMTLTPSSEQEN